MQTWQASTRTALDTACYAARIVPGRRSRGTGPPCHTSWPHRWLGRCWWQGPWECRGCASATAAGPPLASALRPATCTGLLALRKSPTGPATINVVLVSLLIQLQWAPSCGRLVGRSIPRDCSMPRPCQDSAAAAIKGDNAVLRLTCASGGLHSHQRAAVLSRLGCPSSRW